MLSNFSRRRPGALSTRWQTDAANGYQLKRSQKTPPPSHDFQSKQGLLAVAIDCGNRFLRVIHDCNFALQTPAADGVERNKQTFIVKFPELKQ
jgi:hypothetical protein